MIRKDDLLNNIRVASPCNVPWSSMRGNERVRFCGECKLNVYNLSEMSRPEAEALIRSSEGRLCVRFYRRHDDTVLTRDCPVGLRAVRIRVVRAVGIAAAAFFTLLGFGSVAGSTFQSFWEGINRSGEDSGMMGKVDVTEVQGNARRSVTGAMAPMPVKPGSAE